MNTMILANAYEAMKGKIIEKAPEILIGGGTALLFSGAIIGVSTTIKACKKLEGKNLSKAEKVRAVWKDYIPMTGLVVVGTICIIAGTVEGNKRNAALAAALVASEGTLKDYKQAVKKMLNPEKEEKVVEIEEETEDGEKKKRKETIVVCNTGQKLMMRDSWTGRKFEMSLAELYAIVNEFNANLVEERCMSLNDWYDYLTLDRVEGGYDAGWNISHGVLQLDLEPVIDDDQTLVVNVDFKKGFRPNRDFESANMW